MTEEGENGYQQEILKQLDKYGESFLDKTGFEKLKERKGKLHKQQRTLSEDLSSNSSSVNNKSKSKKKKAKLKKLEANSLKSNTKDKIRNKKTGEQRYLQELKNELDKCEIVKPSIVDDNVRTTSETDGKVVTLYDEHLKKQNLKRKAQEVVVITDPSKKKKKETVTSGNTDKVTPERKKYNQREFDFRKARYEVKKFGIKGLHGIDKEKAMTALLIKLGAKPPKNEYFNYKEYQDMRQKERESAKDKREVDRALGYKVTNPNKNKKRRRDRNDVGIIDGQVGRYKSGVQYVRKEDLVGFDNKRNRR